MASQLASLEPSLSSKEFAQIISLPKTFEDSYVAVSDETACPWSVDPKSVGKEWNAWVTVDGGVCRVIKKPTSPIPLNLKTWMQKHNWKKANLA